MYHYLFPRRSRLQLLKALLLVTALLLIMYGLLPRRSIVGGEAPRVNDRNIFFVETTCATEKTALAAEPVRSGMIRLEPRQACALEAAASFNPSRPVYFVHTCPLNTDPKALAAWPEYAQAILELPNVHVWPVSFVDAMAAAPRALYNVVKRNDLDFRLWPMDDAAHLLRYMLLWHYAGTAIDGDCLLLRSLEERKDFAAMESNTKISGVIIDLSLEPIGRILADECFNKMANFAPKKLESWDWSTFMNSILQNLCEIQDLRNIGRWYCFDFDLLKEKKFYPVPHDMWELYFNVSSAEKVMSLVSKSMGIHTRSLKSQNVIHVNSEQPAAQVVRRVCPKVVSSLTEPLM